MTATKRLTDAQEHMLHELLREGPFCLSEMAVRFGRRWQEVYRRLEKAGYAQFAPYAKDARHWQATGRLRPMRKREEEAEILATTCFYCGDPAIPETHGLDPRCKRHHDV